MLHAATATNPAYALDRVGKATAIQAPTSIDGGPDQAGGEQAARRRTARAAIRRGE